MQEAEDDPYDLCEGGGCVLGPVGGGQTMIGERNKNLHIHGGYLNRGSGGSSSTGTHGCQLYL